MYSKTVNLYTHTHNKTMATLLPTLQFARLYSKQPDGKQVFLTTCGKLVCPHGECSSTICYWLRMERQAREAGRPPPPRGGSRGASTCDCQDTEGLNCKPCESIHPPAAPPSLFQFLEEQETEEISVKGRAARCIPYHSGPTFVTSHGRLCCRHGFSRLSLNAKKKAGERPSVRLPTCGCVLKPLPKRSGLKALQLGKFARVRVLVDANDEESARTSEHRD